MAFDVSRRDGGVVSSSHGLAYSADQSIDACFDMIYISDDGGSQKDLMFSREHFRRYIRPAYERI